MNKGYIRTPKKKHQPLGQWLNEKDMFTCELCLSSGMSVHLIFILTP